MLLSIIQTIFSRFSIAVYSNTYQVTVTLMLLCPSFKPGFTVIVATGVEGRKRCTDTDGNRLRYDKIDLLTI